ncbi:MAG: helix-turn-helix domain-containing protein [Saprospiraceae bacterium]|nr:helix-turn-helix domain-containing protein [Saprospiraceae bacterium]
MKNISILVPETAVVEAVADPRYMFSAVNEFLKSEGKPPVFSIQLVGMTPEVRLAGGAFSIHADVALQTARKPDLIIIPAVSGDLSAAIEVNRPFFPWVLAQYENGAEVASLCVGAFLLAATGLLDGKPCSTHWLFAGEFRRRFPQVNLMEQKIICENKGVYSSGGANSYWNLLLHLVEKYTNRDMAILAAKFFVLDFDRQSQSPFAMFKGQKMHTDDEIRQAQEFIEHHFREKISVDDLAGKCAIGRRSFERRFKAATNNTAVEYIQRVKIEAAKRSFESSRKNINEVMFDVGYTDTKAFRDVFKKITGLTPVDYRNKYNKQVLSPL